MPAISIDRGLVLLCLVLFAGTLSAQEGPPEATGPEPDISTMGILGGLADPALVMRPAPAGATDILFSSRGLAEGETAPEGSYVHGGLVSRLRSCRFGERTEFVMAELEGPGVIRRIWMETLAGGHLRLRYEGQDEPVLDLECEALRKGIVRLFEPPIGAAAGKHGFELIRPIPFSGKILLTSDQAHGHFLVEASRFSEGTTVAAFTTTSAIGESFPLAPLLAELQRAAQPDEIAAPKPNRARVIAAPDASASLAPGESLQLIERETETPSVLAAIEIETLAPFSSLELPLGLILSVVVDGEKTIEAPLDLLFGGSRFVARSSLHLKIDEPLERRMRRRRLLLPQPFEHRISVSLSHAGELTSPTLRFRFSFGPADESAGGRRLRSLVLDGAHPSAAFPGPATIVAESVSAPDRSTLLGLRLVMDGLLGESPNLGVRLGCAGSETRGTTLGSGFGDGEQIVAWRSRLFDRFQAKGRVTLAGDPGPTRYLILGYVDAEKK